MTTKDYEKGHKEGWDDCLEEHDDELSQLIQIDEILSRRTALENIPDRVKKIAFMASELERLTTFSNAPTQARSADSPMADAEAEYLAQKNPAVATKKPEAKADNEE